MINLYQPRFQIAVQKHVEPKYLKTVLILHILGQTRLINVAQTRLRRYYRLNHYVLYLHFQFFHIIPLIFQQFVKAGKTSFVRAFIALFFACGLLIGA